MNYEKSVMGQAAQRVKVHVTKTEDQSSILRTCKVGGENQGPPQAPSDFHVHAVTQTHAHTNKYKKL